MKLGGLPPYKRVNPLWAFVPTQKM